MRLGIDFGARFDPSFLQVSFGGRRWGKSSAAAADARIAAMMGVPVTVVTPDDDAATAVKRLVTSVGFGPHVTEEEARKMLAFAGIKLEPSEAEMATACERLRAVIDQLESAAGE